MSNGYLDKDQDAPTKYEFMLSRTESIRLAEVLQAIVDHDEAKSPGSVIQNNDEIDLLLKVIEGLQDQRPGVEI